MAPGADLRHEVFSAMAAGAGGGRRKEQNIADRGSPCTWLSRSFMSWLSWLVKIASARAKIIYPKSTEGTTNKNHTEGAISRSDLCKCMDAHYWTKNEGQGPLHCSWNLAKKKRVLKM